jgi:transposase
MAIVLPDARELSDEVLEALRLRALRGCELGFTEGEVAEMLGVSRETVSRWCSGYRSAGLDGLPHGRTGRPVGSGRTLSEEQANRIQELIDNNTPEKLGIASPLWTRPAVRDLIRKECDIDMPVRTVGEYLKRWGYTAKRPQRHAKKQDPEEVRVFLEQTYPMIEEWARQEDAEIHWCDETGVAADEHPALGYARVGQPAILDVPDPHIRVNVISTVTNSGDFHFTVYTHSMNAKHFISFLDRLTHETTHKVFVITDRLSAHDAQDTHNWLDARTDRIEMFFQPRRSPELNADEYFNQDLKANVHKAGLPNSTAELRSRTQTFLEKLRQLPEHIMSYFEHPCVQFAAGS